MIREQKIILQGDLVDMRTRFDEQLAQLKKTLIEMGALCEKSIELVAEAMTESNIEKAENVKPLASQVDETEHKIESLCITLLLQQQPVAKDLRQVSAALKMITDMKRVADQAEDIADIVCILVERKVQNLELFNEMAKSTMQMVKEAVDSFVNNDIIKAEKVINDDDKVDELFDNSKDYLMNEIRQNTPIGENALDLLMVSKYFERIGDHTVNIANWVIYSITGTHKED